MTLEKRFLAILLVAALSAVVLHAAPQQPNAEKTPGQPEKATPGIEMRQEADAQPPAPAPAEGAPTDPAAAPDKPASPEKPAKPVDANPGKPATAKPTSKPKPATDEDDDSLSNCWTCLLEAAEELCSYFLDWTKPSKIPALNLFSLFQGRSSEESDESTEKPMNSPLVPITNLFRITRSLASSRKTVPVQDVLVRDFSVGSLRGVPVQDAPVRDFSARSLGGVPVHDVPVRDFSVGSLGGVPVQDAPVRDFSARSLGGVPVHDVPVRDFTVGSLGGVPVQDAPVRDFSARSLGGVPVHDVPVRDFTVGSLGGVPVQDAPVRDFSARSLGGVPVHDVPVSGFSARSLGGDPVEDVSVRDFSARSSEGVPVEEDFLDLLHAFYVTMRDRFLRENPGAISRSTVDMYERPNELVDVAAYFLGVPRDRLVQVYEKLRAKDVGGMLFKALGDRMAMLNGERRTDDVKTSSDLSLTPTSISYFFKELLGSVNGIATGFTEVLSIAFQNLTPSTQPSRSVK